MRNERKFSPLDLDRNSLDRRFPIVNSFNSLTPLCSNYRSIFLFQQIFSLDPIHKQTISEYRSAQCLMKNNGTVIFVEKRQQFTRESYR